MEQQNPETRDELMAHLRKEIEEKWRVKKSRSMSDFDFLKEKFENDLKYSSAKSFANDKQQHLKIFNFGFTNPVNFDFLFKRKRRDGKSKAFLKEKVHFSESEKVNEYSSTHSIIRQKHGTNRREFYDYKNMDLNSFLKWFEKSRKPQRHQKKKADSYKLSLLRSKSKRSFSKIRSGRMRKKSLYKSLVKINSRKKQTPAIKEESEESLENTSFWPFSIFRQNILKYFLPQRNERSESDFLSSASQKQEANEKKPKLSPNIIPRFYSTSVWSHYDTVSSDKEFKSFDYYFTSAKKDSTPKPSSSTISKLSMQKSKSKTFAKKLFEKYH